MTAPASRLTQSERQVRVKILRDQIALMLRYAHETGERQHARWLLKEVVYKVWEQPQIPKPRFDKYSLWFPWSPRAFERLEDYRKGGRRPDITGLRLEHLIPRGVLAEKLLEKEPRNLARFLDTYFRPAVITIEDDAQLNRHGMRSRVPHGWELRSDSDLWARYRHAGFSPHEFVVPCEAQPELA